MSNGDSIRIVGRGQGQTEFVRAAHNGIRHFFDSHNLYMDIECFLGYILRDSLRENKVL